LFVLLCWSHGHWPASGAWSYQLHLHSALLPAWLLSLSAHPIASLTVLLPQRASLFLGHSSLSLARCPASASCTLMTCQTFITR
jgi:hypothetical protein